MRDLAIRIKELDAWHAFLGDPNQQSIPGKTWLIYGTGCRTEVRVGFSGAATPEVDDQGDEVVPVLSATALNLGNRMIPVTGLKHAEACQNKDAQRLVAAILSGSPPSGIAAGLSFQAAGSPPTTPASPADSGLEEWLRGAKKLATQTGGRVRVVIEFQP
jgi:hypothetical protein